MTRTVRSSGAVSRNLLDVKWSEVSHCGPLFPGTPRRLFTVLRTTSVAVGAAESHGSEPRAVSPSIKTIKKRADETEKENQRFSRVPHSDPFCFGEPLKSFGDRG